MPSSSAPSGLTTHTPPLPPSGPCEPPPIKASRYERSMPIKRSFSDQPLLAQHLEDGSGGILNPATDHLAARALRSEDQASGLGIADQQLAFQAQVGGRARFDQARLPGIGDARRMGVAWPFRAGTD